MRLRQPIPSTTGRSSSATAAAAGPHRATRGLAAIAMLTALAACGGGHQAPPPAPASEAPAATVFDDMTSTMDKARGVQDTVDQQKQALDRQVKAAEGADQ